MLKDYFLVTFPKQNPAVPVTLRIAGKDTKAYESCTHDVVDYGLWGDWEFCDFEDVVYGFAAKIEPVQGGGDDTGMNGLKFMCGHLTNQGDIWTSVKNITSKLGPWGIWLNDHKTMANTAINAIQIFYQVAQGDGDDTATDGIRVFFTDGSTMEGNIILY